MAKRKGKTWHWGRIFVGMISLFFVVGGVAALWIGSLKIPDFNTFEERKIAQSTKIYDRTGEILLYDVHENIKRTVVPYGEISHHIKNATVAIEDAEFYEHIGVRPMATLRAVFLQPLRGKGVQGGSTITQQVVKNTLLTQEKKISRKLKEWTIAIKLEQVMSKEDILALYLNESPYGGSIYGVEEASQSFFGKPAKEVTLAEAAYLAALPQAPTFYSPYGNNTDALETRKNLVLSRMWELGFITEQEYEEAKIAPVSFLPPSDRGIRAPHFVLYVRSYLEEKYGKDVVEQGGLKVTTTLNYEYQQKAEEIINRYALENAEKFNAENAGLIAVDPQTGQILSMVGSRDYFDEEIDGNFNITLAHRQPGSAFKPFVYATAFKKGYTPETVVFDLETQFETRCDAFGRPLFSEVDPDSCYTPVNYDGVYHGPMSLRNALAQSVNVPAIKTLYLAGLSDSLQTAKDFGISSLTNVDQYGLTLVLGGGEVSLLDITNAYGVFANEGVRNPHTPILRIENNAGDILEEFSKRDIRVIDEHIARSISDILSDNDARAPAFGQRSYLFFEGRDVAVKTGTTNDYRDAWIVGYTPRIAVGTWAGNNNNSSMEKRVAGFIVAPMWREFMNEIIPTLPEESFSEPPLVGEDIKPILRGVWEGGITYTIDRISGKRATEFTPEETREERVVTDVHSILHWVDKRDPLGPIPENPENDPQFTLWEIPVLAWAEAQGLVSQNPDEVIPEEFDDVHTKEHAPSITITSPTEQQVFSQDDRVFVSFTHTSARPIVRADYFVNGLFIGSSSNPPFSFSFIPRSIKGIAGENILRVHAYDDIFNQGQTTTILRVQQ